MKASIGIALLAMTVIGCRPGGLDGEATGDGETNGDSETGDGDSCENWAGEFVVAKQVQIPPEGRQCGAAAVLPSADGSTEVVVFVSAVGDEPASFAVRFAIAPDGQPEVLETTGPTAELPQDVFAFDDSLIAVHRIEVVSGDVVTVGYAGSAKSAQSTCRALRQPCCSTISTAMISST